MKTKNHYSYFASLAMGLLLCTQAFSFHWVNPRFPAWGMVGPMTWRGHGAIAYSQRTGNVGWARGFAFEEDAWNEALFHCRAADCTVAVTVNRGCATVATSSFNFSVMGWGLHGTQAGAQQRALFECQSRGAGPCVLRATVCTY